MKDLTNGKPLKLIITFAIPLFIGQLFQLFYSLVDTRIVGQILGETSLAAVGSTTSLSDMLIGLLNGLTNGFAIIISTFYGAKDYINMKKSIAATLLLSIGFTIIISILCLLLNNQILSILNVSDTILSQAKSYICVILAGLIASTIYNAYAAILRAIGDSFTPLIFLVISTITNIALDYIFILWFDMNVAGAAFATVVSQGISAVLCFFYVKKRYPQLSLEKKDYIPVKNIYNKLIKTGLSMGFMVSFVNIGTVALQTSINTFGTNIIVAHTAARKATTMFMLPFSVFGTTLATYCGQNLGAKEYNRIKQGIKQTVLLTFIWCIFVVITAYTIAPTIIHIITASDIKEVMDTASLYLRVNTSLYFVPAVICLFRNSMQGFGDSKTPVFSSSLELIGKVLIAFFLAPRIGYWGIIIAEPIVWIIMVIPLIINMYRNPIFKET
ncbi:MAG: MATE family efflux transporter [Lachnospira sp.]|nr:MATE family efflux transporter [Lachnospira sp.]